LTNGNIHKYLKIAFRVFINGNMFTLYIANCVWSTAVCQLSNKLLITYLLTYLPNRQIDSMKEEYYTDAMVSPAPKYLLGHASLANALVNQMETSDRVHHVTDFRETRQNVDSSTSVLACVCVLDIDSVSVPASIKSMIQARIDRMEEMEKTVVKTASILGLRFTRKMLKHLLGVSCNYCAIIHSLLYKIKT